MSLSDSDISCRLLFALKYDCFLSGIEYESSWDKSSNSLELSSMGSAEPI